MDGKMLTIKELAERMGLSEVTVRKYCRKGVVLPNATKLDYNGWSCWVAPESDIEGWQDRRPKPGRPNSTASDGSVYQVTVDGKVVASYKASAIGIRQCQQGYDEAAFMFLDTDKVVKVMNGEKDATFLFSGNGQSK